MRESTVFYRSFYEAIKELDAELQAQVYSAIFEYALNFNEVALSGVAKTVFTLIKPQLDANQKRYSNGMQAKNKQSISKHEAKGKQTKSNTLPNVNDNVNANDNVNVNVNVNQNENDNANDNVNSEKRKRFTAPTYDDVLNFMIEINGLAKNVFTHDRLITESKNFFNHYESVGWVVGRAKMKDWHAAIRKWLNNSVKFEKQNIKSHQNGNTKVTQREQQLNQYRQHIYNDDDQLRDIQRKLSGNYNP